MAKPDQSSVSDDQVAWFQDMEHVMGHFISELDSLETSLRDGDKRDSGVTITEVGFLLLYLRGWRESAKWILELVAKCELLTDDVWRDENSLVDSGFYARRAEHYQFQADYLRALAERPHANA